MAASLLVLCLCAAAVGSEARLPPGASPLVTACSAGPFQESCVRELGPRLIDVQTALASVSPRAALIAGAPGQVDLSSLVAVAMEAAAEAGAVASVMFDGKLPGFNASSPEFRVCLDNCTVTVKSAMKKIRGATAAMKAGANDVAKTLANRAIADVSSCTLSCKSLSGDVKIVLETSLVEFQKMLSIAVTFIGKIKTKTPPAPPPAIRP